MHPTWIQRHRLLTLLGVAAVVAWAGLQLRELRFDFSPQHLFELDDGDPRTRFWQRSLRAFGRGDNQLFVVAESERPGGVLGDDVRAHLRLLEDALTAKPYALGVLSADSLALPVAGADGLAVVHGRALSATELLQHPLVQGHLVSSDGRLGVLVLSIADSHRRVEELTVVVEEVEAWLQANPAPPGLQLGLAGVPFVRADVVRALKADQLRFIPLTALLVALALFLTLRDAWRTLLPLVTVCCATLVGVGVAVRSGAPVDIVNQILPILILVIGVSDGLHLVARYGDELRLGHSPQDALAVTVRRLVLACLVTSLTTAAGFASLASMQTPVIRRFGVLAAIAVLLAYVVTLTLLPALLALAPAPRSVGAPWLARLALRASQVGTRWPRRVVALSLLLGVASGGLGLWRVHADIHLIDYLPADHDSRARLQRVERHLGGVLSMDVVLELGPGLAASDPRVLSRLLRLQHAVQALPGVSSCLSPVDVLAELQRAVAAPQPPRLPATEQALAQLWLLTELSAPDLALQRFVGEDGRLLRMTLRLLDVGGRRSLALAERIEVLGAGLFADLPGVRVHATGDAESVSRHIIVVIRDLYLSLCLAGGAIFLCLLVVFRSWRLALLAVPPNILPLLVTAGFMGALGVDLDISTVVIFSVTLGLAVDDTVHILARVREESLAGGSWSAVLERSMLGSGHAVVMTSVVLSAGMLVLLSSNFTPTRMFGLLTLVTVAGALAADLLLLPALLVLFPPRSRQS